MAMMESLKDKASNAAQSAAKAAKHVASISKMRLEIVKEQDRIRRNYSKLGKVYYKDYVTDEEPDEAEYKPLCDEITESYRRINELKEEIAAEKEAFKAGEEVCDDPGVPCDEPCEEPCDEPCEEPAPAEAEEKAE